MELERGRNDICLTLYILPDREDDDALGGSEEFDRETCFAGRGFKVLEYIIQV